MIFCNHYLIHFNKKITTKLFLNHFAGNIVCFVQTLLGEEHVKASFGLNQGMSSNFVKKFLQLKLLLLLFMPLFYPTSSPRRLSSTNSGSKIPSSLFRKGSCLVKAFPGILGIMICTVLANSSLNHYNQIETFSCFLCW